MIERSTKNLRAITLYRYEIREQSYRKINDWSTLLVKRKQDFGLLVIRQMLRIRRIRRLRLMHPKRNTKHRASTSFDFYIVCAILRWLSYVGRRADALALRAEERRDKLRKAAVSCK